jgi:hypothetical protein
LLRIAREEGLASDLLEFADVVAEGEVREFVADVAVGPPRVVARVVDRDRPAGWQVESSGREGARLDGDSWRNLNWAAIAVVRGERDEANRRFVAGTQALRELGVVLDPDDQSELDWLSAQLARVTGF